MTSRCFLFSDKAIPRRGNIRSNQHYPKKQKEIKTMKKHSIKLTALVLALVLVAALALTGCGSKSDDGSSDAPVIQIAVPNDTTNEARALATNPKVLLCDEATSALDPKTTRQILELIGDINKKLGITVVIITHQMSVVKEVCNHVAILDDGEVVEEGLVSTVFSAPKSAAARHLVFPRGADIDVSDPQQQRRIRLIFRSAKTTSIPLVARLATEENITATVISATTQKLSEEVYGGMLLGVPNAQFEQAMDFLKGIENLQVEEASVDVQ